MAVGQLSYRAIITYGYFVLAAHAQWKAMRTNANGIY
jgi:hypothetical protein